MYEALEKIPYEIVKKDPSKKIIRTLTVFKNSSYLPEVNKKSCPPPPIRANTPRLFGHIKNH